MAVLENCEPKRVFHYFEEICNIPHPSYHEKEISDYLVAFAKDHGLEYYQDKLYNVIMIKEATEGYEDVAPIVIQGHMDMVAEKESNCKKDMYKEGLDLEIIDGFVSARGTTLGADDGIAVAYSLALLEDDSLKHPRLEVIITVSEEVGMEGAAGIDVSMLKGRRLLNIDSEAEGIFTVGCAGGCRLNINLPVIRQEMAGDRLIIEVNNCTGGHSGTEIIRGRANATYIANRLLSAISEVTELAVEDFEGGKMDNAIPRKTTCSIIVDSAKTKDVMEAINTEKAAILTEYAITDPDMELTVTVEAGISSQAADFETSAKIRGLLNSLPDGVQTMSHDIEGLVETSLNLGILAMSESQFKLSQSIRSSVDSAKKALVRKCCQIGRYFGAEVNTHGEYPAWEFVRESQFRDTMVEIYEDMFGSKPVVETMHAGLECGLLASKMSGLDAVSIGPELYDIHTPQERLSIESTARYYDFVKRIIEHK